MINARRITDRMLANWKVLKKNNPIPVFDIFSNEPLKDIWTNCFILNVTPGKTLNYKFEYAGEQLITALGRDPVGEVMNSNIKGIPENSIILLVDDVVEKKEPIVQEGIFVNKKSKTIKYRACLLPFTNTRNTKKDITNIVGGIVWQIKY